MRFHTLLNEIRMKKQPKGMPDPALLTIDEYEKVANPSQKSHGNDSYQVTGSLSYMHYENFKPLRRFKSRGIEFELMIKSEKSSYIKTNPETGDPVYDADGKVMSMTDEEVIASGIDPITYTLGVFRDQVCVGSVQDEWGAVLIMVVQEYQGFGLGPILGKVARTMEPYADSGGFTQGGYNNLIKIHQSMVQDYMTNGMYSKLVRDGTITIDRAKEIIASANLKQKPKQKADVGPSGKKLLWTNDMNAWIVYDANLRNVMDEVNEGHLDDMFSEKLILAYCFLVDEEPTYLYELNYADKAAGKVALQAAMSHTEQHGDEMRIRNDNWSEVWERTRALGYDVEIDEPFPETNIPYETFQKLASIEQRWRKSFDQYGEFEVLMQELADRTYNQ